jgi:putative hemolysin
VDGFGAELLIIVFMVLFNAVFAAYEIGLASVSLSRLKMLEREGKRGAKAALRMKQGVEASLASVQLGITLVGAVAAAVGGAGGVESFAPGIQNAWGIRPQLARAVAITAVVAPLTFATIVLGELVPKLLALRNREGICLLLSPIMLWFTRSVWPLVRLLEATAESLVWVAECCWPGRFQRRSDPVLLHELWTLAAEARTARVIGGQEERIIVGATRLAHRPVKEIMIPAAEIVTLPVDITAADALAVAHQDMHTRYPVTERPQDVQSVVGYVNFKDIVLLLRTGGANRTLRDIQRPLPSFSEQATISYCLERMMRDRAHIAVIRDAQQQVVGMITLEDVVEELVGEIEDEYDRIPDYVFQASPNSWLVGGGTPLAKLQDHCGASFNRSEGEKVSPRLTLDEWVHRQLGRSPRGGDLLRAGSWRVLVRKVRRHHVLEAQVLLDQTLTPTGASRALQKPPAEGQGPPIERPIVQDQRTESRQNQ